MGLHTNIQYGFIVKPYDESEDEQKKAELFKKLIDNIYEKYKHSPKLDDEDKEIFELEYKENKNDLLSLYNFYDLCLTVVESFHFEINSNGDEIYCSVYNTCDNLYNGYDITAHINYFEFSNTEVFDKFKQTLKELDVEELSDNCIWYTLFEGSY